MLAVENHLMIVEEMTLSFDNVYFWSDSMVVLGWIKSDDAKLPKYIDRRVTSIRDASGADQWRHVSTDVNPADAATRGSCDVTAWLQAPRFLIDGNNLLTSCVSARADTGKVMDDSSTAASCLSNGNNICDQLLQLGNTGAEAAQNNTANDGLSNTDNAGNHVSSTLAARAHPANTNNPDDPTAALINHFSSLYRLKRSVIWLYKYVNWRRNKAVAATRKSTGCACICSAAFGRKALRTTH